MIGIVLTAVLFLQGVQTQQIQPGTITGRLSQRDGTPASAIRIAAVPIEEAEGDAGTPVMMGISLTDAEGRYRIENIPPGRYFIVAGLISFPSYYPNATSIKTATPVTVGEGATLAGVDFIMARSAGLTISGRLGIPSTMQFRGATVMLNSQNPVGAPSINVSVQAGPNGKFEFPRLSPGSYRLSSTLLGATSATVTLDDTDALDVVLPVIDCNAGAKVSGRLVGSAAAAIRTISLSRNSAACSASASIDSDGSFVFDHVPEGTYRVQLTPAPFGWSAENLTVGTSDSSGIEFKLPEAIVFTGRAVVEDGSPFPRTARGTPISIQARRSGIPEVVASILDDGTFVLPLPPGNYRLAVSGIPGGTHYLKSLRNGDWDLQVSPLEVSEAANKDIQLSLGLVQRQRDRGVRVSGRLTFATTGVLPKSDGVLLVDASSDRTKPIRQANLGTDGSFEFTNVPPGTYNLETFPDNPAALYGIAVDAFDVSGIDFAIPPLVQIKGGIEWASSRGAAPAANVSVQFTRKLGNRLLAWGTLTQADAFHFYLPEGEYRFSVTNVPANYDVAGAMAGDVNILNSVLLVKSDRDPPVLRVTLRQK